MPKFGKKSQERLDTCHSDLIRLFTLVVRYFDCTILEGHRGKEKQNRYYKEGKSKIQWPDGKHNNYPSEAVDVAPYPIDWEDRDRFHYFGGFVMGLAKSMDISLRWGGDWDMDTQVKDNKFDDLPHFELKEA